MFMDDQNRSMGLERTTCLRSDRGVQKSPPKNTKKNLELNNKKIPNLEGKILVGLVKFYLNVYVSIVT